MLSKSHRLNYSVDALNLTSMQAFKSRNLSRLFPLLSSLKYSQKPKSQWTREFRGNAGEKQFVVLIFICYKGWQRRTKSGNLEEMELKGVQNDLPLLLDYLRFQHDDTSKNWYFILDFDLEYTDWTGVTKMLPRTTPAKDDLLRTVREATRKGASGFIHVGAHCHYEHSGTSALKAKGQTMIYSESPHKKFGRRAAYIISSDGHRVYGKEFYPCLSDDYDVGRDETLTLSLDMCNAGAFLKEEVNLPRMTATFQSRAFRTTAVKQARRRKQLILVSSSQPGQPSGSLHDKAGNLFGATTSLMIGSLKRRPLASPLEVAQYLNDVCSKRPEENKRQSPSIACRYPIQGPLRLLPGPTAEL